MGPAFMRKYATGTGADIYIPIIKAASQDFAVGADWTPAIGDVKFSIDGGAQANVTNLPTYVNGSWKFVFENAELTGKKISIRVVDSATKAVEDQAFEIETFGHASAFYPTDFSAATLAVSIADPVTLTVGERNAIAAALLDLTDGIETGLTMRNSMKLITSALAGIFSGAGTGTISIQKYGGGTVRITATVDVSGNRSVIVYSFA